MAELKTKPTPASVDEFLDAIPEESVREDCRIIAEMMRQATKAQPRMWGPSIVGYGTTTCRDAKGKEQEWMEIAFSPRKQNITLYILSDFDGCEELLARLGKHSRGKSCLYVKRLSDVHRPTLRRLIEASVRHVRRGRRVC